MEGSAVSKCVFRGGGVQFWAGGLLLQFEAPNNLFKMSPVLVCVPLVPGFDLLFSCGVTYGFGQSGS
jgi:hypothetical protein